MNSKITELNNNKQSILIMLKPVTLLVCLSPSISAKLINELSFYHIINPIAPVSNLKIITKEGQIKAFVQVENQDSADKVIDKLHGKLLNVGKVKIFITHKKYINYNATLQKVLAPCSNISQECFMKTKMDCIDKIKNFNIDAFNINQRPITDKKNGVNSLKKIPINETHDVVNENSRFQIDDTNTVNFNSVSYKAEVENCLSNMGCSYKVNCGIGQNNANESRWVITVTHNDIQALDEKQISRVFKQFGRVLNLQFNYQAVSWSVQYESENDAKEAVYAIQKKKLFGYQLCFPPDELFKYSTSKRAHKCCRTSTKSFNHTNNKYMAKMNQQNYIFNILRVDLYKNRMNIQDLCKIIARIQVPIKIVQAVDLKFNHYFFLVEFKYCFEAAEVFTFLNDLVIWKKI